MNREELKILAVLINEDNSSIEDLINKGLLNEEEIEDSTSSLEQKGLIKRNENNSETIFTLKERRKVEILLSNYSILEFQITFEISQGPQDISADLYGRCLTLTPFREKEKSFQIQTRTNYQNLEYFDDLDKLMDWFILKKLEENLELKKTSYSLDLYVDEDELNSINTPGKFKNQNQKLFFVIRK